MIVDVGVGMKENVRKHMRKEIEPEEAIEWATKEKNTTKPRNEEIPGGLGLKLLCDFIKVNKGSMRIVSDAGYCYWEHGSSFDNEEFLFLNNNKMRFDYPFPGTAVSIKINTAETGTSSVSSLSITDSDDIF